MLSKELCAKYGKIPVYLWEDETETYIKVLPGRVIMAKRRGGKEFEIDATNHIVVRAALAEHEVTREEYENA